MGILICYRSFPSFDAETTVIKDGQSGIGGRLEPYKMAEFQFLEHPIGPI